MNSTNGAATWIELRVTVPLDAQEAMGGFLWELGAEGLTEEPMGRDGLPWVILKAYVQTPQPDQLVSQTQAYLLELDEFFPETGRGRVSFRPIEMQDWDAEWKAHFKPTRVSTRLVIRPSWEPYTPEAGDVVVDLDPGMAFGTGTHETTRGCLKMIDALFGSADANVTPVAPGGPVLDVGTGSGILLIATLLLGAASGVGNDIDPVAIMAATENVARNQLSDRISLTEDRLETLSGEYPLVLANILAPTLIDLAPHLEARLARGGALVLSGLLLEQARAVQAAFLPLGLTQEASIEEGEWATLLLRKSS